MNNTTSTDQVAMNAQIAIELQGHLIDSLTLAKVIDTIQLAGGDYYLNHLLIGHQKNQLSSVQLTLLAENNQQLSEIMTQIQPYGAQPSSLDDVTLTTCQAEGQVPSEAMIPMSIPHRIRVGSQWLDVLQEDLHMAIVVDVSQKKATLKRLSEIKANDQIVMGFHGIEWAPIGESL